MSHKAMQDKQRPGWPWTARQRRQKLDKRNMRKFKRHRK